MSRSLPLYATGSDLLGLFAAIESQRPLRYVVAGGSDQQAFESFDSSRQLPKLGNASAGAQERETFYLVVNANDGVEVRAVPQRRGGTRFVVDQLLNPCSVVLRPGGVFQDECIIAGQIGTASSERESEDLLKLFYKELRRLFTKVKSYYVGDEALRLLDSGMRLTANVRSPADYDLMRE